MLTTDKISVVCEALKDAACRRIVSEPPDLSYELKVDHVRDGVKITATIKFETESER